jgi:hypothetical protein
MDSFLFSFIVDHSCVAMNGIAAETWRIFLDPWRHVITFLHCANFYSMDVLGWNFFNVDPNPFIIYSVKSSSFLRSNLLFIFKILLCELDQIEISLKSGQQKNVSAFNLFSLVSNNSKQFNYIIRLNCQFPQQHHQIRLSRWPTILGRRNSRFRPYKCDHQLNRLLTLRFVDCKTCLKCNVSIHHFVFSWAAAVDFMRQ